MCLNNYFNYPPPHQICVSKLLIPIEFDISAAFFYLSYYYWCNVYKVPFKKRYTTKNLNGFKYNKWSLEDIHTAVSVSILTLISQLRQFGLILILNSRICPHIKK